MSKKNKKIDEPIGQLVSMEDFEKDYTDLYQESKLVNYVNKIVALNLMALGEGFRSLSKLEWDVLRLVSMGKTTKEMILKVGRSKSTVRRAYNRAIDKISRKLEN